LLYWCINSSSTGLLALVHLFGTKDTCVFVLVFVFVLVESRSWWFPMLIHPRLIDHQPNAVRMMVMMNIKSVFDGMALC